MGEDELTREEATGTATLLLIAGHETTANMIGLGALTLIRHPHAAGELRADPSLMPGAVEELPRFHSITRGGPRRAAIVLLVALVVQQRRSSAPVVPLVVFANPASPRPTSSGSSSTSG
ncbi:cytochrome P450 [Streptomyces malaysiense]|uniref:Cytochrome n=1 Tax=Streptomyces malaysiense TaxID=1428626 RepID=A0A1J4PU18_9ACTN|nr:hypothetical protein VT52_030645 [Streptomyces malaysiense]